MKKWLILLGLLVFASDAFALEIEVPKKVYEGTAFKVILKNEGLNAYKYEAYFLGRKYKFFSEGRFIDALDAVSWVAVPLGEKRGTRVVEIKKDNAVAGSIGVVVSSKTFPAIVVDFKPLSRSDLARHKAEQDEINQITSRYDDKLAKIGQFDWPKEEGCIVTSLFGEQRLNKRGQVIGRHWGTDCKAAIGDDVFAINDGKIVMAQETLLGGKTVIIDHGYGIFSIYMHLSEIGNDGRYAWLIGRAGATGRAYGPHLHFAIKVNGIYVDPIEFMKMAGVK